MGKVLLSLASLGVLLLLNSFMTTVIQPEVSTEFLMEQFKNPSAQTDSMNRFWHNNATMISSCVVGVVWISFNVFLFRKGNKEV